jgi:hypothetical protein
LQKDSLRIKQEFLKLAVADPTAITTTAGILKRIKNWFKGMTDSDVKESQSILIEETKELSNQLPEFYGNIRKLLQCIKDLDYVAYRELLPIVQEQSLILSVKVKEVAVAAKTIEKQYRPSYTAKEYEEKRPELINETKEYLSQHRPDNDVGYGTISKPVSSFKWFKQFKPEEIQISDPAWKAFEIKLLKNIPLSASDKEQVLSMLDNPQSKLMVASALMNGELISYSLPGVSGKDKQGNPFKERKFGVMRATIRSDSFTLPGLNYKFQTVVSLLDMASALESKPYLVWAECAGTSHIKTASSKGRLLLLKKLARANPQAARSLPPEFWDRFVEMSKRLNAVPEDLAKVLYNESGFDPGAINIQNGRPVAKGLCQLLAKTAVGLGMPKEQWDTLENIPAIDQLEWVERYFKAAGKLKNDTQWNSATELYVALAAPAFLSKANDPSAPLYNRYKPDGKLNPNYIQNKALDRDGKGYISPGDLTVSVNRPLPDFIIAGIQQAKGPQQTHHEQITQLVDYHPSPANDDLLNRLFASQSISNIVKEATQHNFIINFTDPTACGVAEVLIGGMPNTTLKRTASTLTITTLNQYRYLLAIREAVALTSSMTDKHFNYTIGRE